MMESAADQIAFLQRKSADTSESVPSLADDPSVFLWYPFWLDKISSYLTHYIETHNDDKVGTYENELDELEEKYPIDDLLEKEQRKRERNEETKEQLKRIKSEQMMLRKIRNNDKKRGIVLWKKWYMMKQK